MIKRQQGFTLVELLISMFITALIIGVVGTAIYQIFTVTEYGNARLLTIHELQNVVHWVSRDGQTAISATGGTQLTLTLPDNSSIIYNLTGTNLYRVSAGSQMTLAQNISSANFSIQGRTITMSLTSSSPDRWQVSEQGTYQVYLRPTEVP